MLLRTKRLILFCASGTLRACFFFFRHFILWLRSAVEEDIADEKILQNRDKKALISNGNHSKTATTRARTTMHSRRPTKTPARTRCRLTATTRARATHEDSCKVKMKTPARSRCRPTTYYGGQNIFADNVTPTAYSGL